MVHSVHVQYWLMILGSTDFQISKVYTIHYYFHTNSTNLQNIFKFQATTNSTNFLVTYETKRDDLKHQTIWKKRTGNCRGFFKAAAQVK